MVASQLRQANTVSQGGVGIKIEEGSTTKFSDWVGNVRRRLLTWAVRISARGLDQMPHALATLDTSVARDVIDTPSVRRMLIAEQSAPKWGPELLRILVPPAFPDINTSSSHSTQEDND